MGAYGTVLAVLAFLFLLRVLGQALDFFRGPGFFVVPRPRVGRILLVGSLLYWVLAAYLFTLARFHRAPARAARPE